jgi:hypothetical protein
MNLNIRNVPPELMRSIKMKAVESELGVRGYCLQKLGECIHIIKKPEPKQASKTQPDAIGVGECPHGFNTRSFCLTMKGGCK